MKYIQYTLLVLCLAFFSCSNKEQSEQIKLNFKTNVDVELLQIYKVQQGDKVLVGEFPLKKNEESHFIDTCAHAFYLIKHNNKFKKIYAELGQSLEFEVDADAVSDKKPSDQNKMIEEWYGLNERVRQLSVDYRDAYQRDLVKLTVFYDAQRQLEKESVDFLKKIEKEHGDSFFSKAMHVLIDAEINYFKLYNRRMPVIAISIKDLPQDLYDPIIKPNRIGDPILLDVFESTIKYIHYYGAWNQRADRLKGKPTIEYVSAPEIQVAYLLYMANFYKDGKGLKDIERRYLHLFESGYALEQLQLLRKNAELMADNANLSKIKVKNTAGDIIKLSDYIGKIIVVDVWATWCGPCMKSRPAYEKLAHKMAGEDVVFLSISVDKSELAWKRIAEKSEGIELLDYDKMFSNAYSISGIPHFLIFDKEGTLFDSPAPYPNRGLEQKIRELMKK